MELRKFLSVFASQKNLFITLLATPIVCILTYFLNQPTTYESTLTLTVVRSNPITTDQIPKSSDEYDSYYRLSADEKFTLTIKQWLESPRIVNDILKESDIDTQSLSNKQLQQTFSITKGSPQVINVQYKSTTASHAKAKAKAITDKLNSLTQKLNEDTQSDSWFTIQSQEPLTRQYEINIVLIIIVSIILGFCLAVLGTLARYYYAKKD